MAWAEAYLLTKWYLDPSSRLATTDMGRKLAGDCALSLGELGPHLAQCGLAEAYLHTKWHLDSSSRMATVYRHGPKIKGGALPPFWG